MALDATQKSSRLFKQSLGKSETNTSRDFFEEPISGKQNILPSQIWNQEDQIPGVAPLGMVDAQVQGVVQRFIDKVLTPVAGTTNSFYHADLKDCIPFDLDPNGSYNYVLKNNTGSQIAFGQGDWLVDTAGGVLTFYGTVPSGMPPKISFYKYVGTKGVGSNSNLNQAVIQPFINTDLTSEKIIISHNLNQTYVDVTVIDNGSYVVIPDEIRYLDPNQVEIDLLSFVPIPGTWNVLIIPGGGTGGSNSNNVITTSVAPSQTLSIDSIADTNKAVKYSVLLETSSKRQSKEIMILNRDVDVDYSISNIIGDRISALMNIYISGTNIIFDVTNNELVSLQVKVLREIIHI